VELGYVGGKGFPASPTATTQAAAMAQARAWQTGTIAAQVSALAQATEAAMAAVYGGSGRS